MKKCFKCGEKKSLSEFYKHSEMSDGRLNKCKECTKAGVKDNRNNKIDYYRDYEKNRAQLPHRVLLRKNYAKTKAGKAAAAKSKKKYRESNPNKYKAHNIVNNAKRDGKIFQEPCCVCGSEEEIHAHHDDYLKPLNVRWLCGQHHREWHAENGEAKNP